MNFLQQSALKSYFVLALAISLSGCSISSDPVKDYEKGKVAFENAEYKMAAECFTEVIEKAPENIDAYVMLARSEFALGNLDAAATALNKAAKTNGDDIDIIELSAQIAFYRKDYKLATKSYARLASNTNLDPSARSIGWTGLGIVDFVRIDDDKNSSRYHEARVKFLQAITLDARNASARYYLGCLYRDTFQYLEAARDQFRAFIYLEKDDTKRVKYVQNVILTSLNEEIKKRSEPNIARIDTVGCASMLKKGDDFFKRKKYKDAITSYMKALKSNPVSYAAAIGLARAYARVNRSRQDNDRTLDAYLVACKIRPSEINTHIEAGDFALRIGKSATAVELYSRALASSPTSVKSVQGLINAFDKSHNDSQAASVYRGYLRTLTKVK